MYLLIPGNARERDFLPHVIGEGLSLGHIDLTERILLLRLDGCC